MVTGGYHASAVPEDLLFDGSPFDIVMKGEAEQLLTDIVMFLLGGGRIEPGIHRPGKVRDLDSLPPMRWELLTPGLASRAAAWPKAPGVPGSWLPVPLHFLYGAEQVRISVAGVQSTASGSGT
jgi:radical SAM superfamily enzyme YgiQ (UPF0313 family)